MAEGFEVRSSTGGYRVRWNTFGEKEYQDLFRTHRVAVVDKNVWDIYGGDRNTLGALDPDRVIIQEAEEELKTVDTSVLICERLLELGFRRGQTLLAIGGGTIQDIVTFSASILFRGVPWVFVPTTLLAQADSCLGGKSSLNLKHWKNQLGNFYPPREIYIAPEFLKTLNNDDFRSGLGEIIKVHFLSGPEMVRKISKVYKRLSVGSNELTEAIKDSLEAKARIVEADEFDQGQRLILNYGHSFGHALETATDFRVPHGIAVLLGVDMANYVGWKMGRIKAEDYERLREIVGFHLRDTDLAGVNVEIFFRALRHDKKNREGEYSFILPSGTGIVEKVFVPMNTDTDGIIEGYLSLKKGGI